MKKLTIAATFLTLLLLASCDIEETIQPEEKTQEKVSFAVNAYEVSKTTLSDYLSFGGDVFAKSNIDILPDAAGKISRYFVSVGDYVSKNDLIAEIDPSRPGMNFETSPVKAVRSGTISNLPFPVGSSVSQQMSLGKISSVDNLEIQAGIAERFVSRVALGQKATLIFDSWQNEEFSAIVTEVSPVLDPVTRTMSVTLEMNPSDERIKPGMYARIKLITEEKTDVVVIPQEAIVTRGDVTAVFVVQDDNTVRLQEIKQSLKVDDLVEVSDGLQEGDVVVVRGQTLLEDGTNVSVVSIDNVDSNNGGI